MAPTWHQRMSVEDGIPLIEQSNAKYVQTEGDMPVRRRRSSADKSATNVTPFAMQQVSAKYSRIPENDHDDATRTPEHLVSNDTAELQKNIALPSSPQLSWSPPALQLDSLSVLLLFNVALLVTLAALLWKSVSSQGLGPDDGSALVFFGWRFAPTLIAVMYVFAWMMLVNDIDRTEPFVRLADSRGSRASSTLLRSPGTWWSILADSIPNRRNDRRLSPVMLCAVTGYIFGFLGLSPLSSVLISPRDVVHIERTNFHQPQLGPKSALQPALDANTHFRTIGNILQNVTTSPWILDQYTVVPFWPSSLAEPPTGAKLSGDAQSWRSQTLVLQTKLSCERLTLERGPVEYNYTFSVWPAWANASRDVDLDLQTLQFSSVSGCAYGFAFINDTVALKGASFWSSISNITIPGVWGSMITDEDYNPVSYSDPAILLNYTASCEGKDVIVSTAGLSGDVFNFTGQLCRHEYYQANTVVNVTITSDATLVTFDEDDYQRIRQPVSDSMINVTNFQNSLLGDGWTQYFTSSSRALLGGPSSLLGALYDFQVPRMVGDVEIGSKAEGIQQRAFGESIQALLIDVPASSISQGDIFTNRRRVVMIPSVAAVIEGILLLHLLFIVWILIQIRGNTRRLGLRYDPAFTDTMISMLTSSDSVRGGLSDLYSTKHTDLSRKIGLNRFRTQNGELQSSTNLMSTIDSKDVPSASDAVAMGKPVLPQVLTTVLMGLLSLLLGAVLVVISVLYWYSTTHGLYQSAFVYQTTIAIDNHSVGTLAPYSIIPSLIAVAISLWWGAIDSVFRRVQPYITMARRATASDHGSGISYQSTYLFWAAYKALSRKHWILALVCTGAFFTQALTIVMSALWQRQPSSLSSQVDVRQFLQLRQIPHLALNVDSWKGADRKAVLADLFNNIRTNWMYSATMQLTLNGSEPPWSSEGWSFVPVDLSHVKTMIDTQHVISNASFNYQATTNVTVRTPAIHGKLECTPLGRMHDSWWLYQRDLTNATGYNVVANISGYDKAYEVGCPAYSNYTYFPAVRPYFRLDANESETDNACDSTAFPVTPFLPEQATMVCCPSGTPDDPGFTSFGYWTSNANTYFQANASWPHGLTVKWLHGTAVHGQVASDDSQPRLLWTEKPQLAAAHCTPVIETANASVTVDLDSGRVLTYDILDEALPDPWAWADPFVGRKELIPKNYTYVINVTTSYGVLFLDSLLGASSLTFLGGCFYGCGVEDLTDHTFNIKRPGLNVDYMTYSMLAMANNDTSALLNSTTLVSLAKRTFSTFFQHFASSNISADGDGGWAFQRVNATLPSDLMPPGAARKSPGAPSRSYEITNATASATLIRPIEILQMSRLAVWLSICILAWLLMTTVLIMIVKQRYFSPLLRGVDTLADIAIMVAGSERYLQLARERGLDGLQADKHFKTRLGWFRTTSGEIRWGIELVDDGVEFLSAEEVKAIMDSKHESLSYENEDDRR